MSAVIADLLPDEDQLSVGAVVLAGDYLWRRAGPALKLRVWLFGRRQVIVHLGKRSVVRWWRDQPYLVSFSEV